MSLIVRPYSAKDLDAVHQLCVMTAPHRIRSESRRLFLFKSSCDYYLDCEPENCFIAVQTAEDGTEKAVGCVLCAEDCEKYAKRFMDKYVPKIKEYSKLNAYIARTDVLMFGKFATFFPSHIRLNVLPEADAGETYTALLDTVRAHLTEKHSKGMLVISDKKNKTSAAFYETYGFSRLGDVGSGTAYGMDF